MVIHQVKPNYALLSDESKKNVNRASTIIGRDVMGLDPVRPPGVTPTVVTPHHMDLIGSVMLVVVLEC